MPVYRHREDVILQQIHPVDEIANYIISAFRMEKKSTTEQTSKIDEIDFLFMLLSCVTLLCHDFKQTSVSYRSTTFKDGSCSAIQPAENKP